MRSRLVARPGRTLPSDGGRPRLPARLPPRTAWPTLLAELIFSISDGWAVMARPFFLTLCSAPAKSSK
jgi:hypothetical protein